MDFDDLFDPEANDYAQGGAGAEGAAGGDDLFMFSGMDPAEVEQLKD